MTYTVNKLDTSLYLYQNSLSILDRLSREYPDSLNYKQALSTSHTRIGDVSGMFGYANLGNTPKAISSYNEAIKIQEYLLEKHPENDEFRNNLALSLSMISSLQFVTGQFTLSINNGYKALSIYEGLLERNPNNFARISSMLSLTNLMRQPLIENLRFDEALSLLRSTESALEVMLKEDPSNKMIQRNIGVNYNSIGRVLTAKGEYAQALIEHEKALRISMDLFKNSESNYESIRDLALTNEFIGNAHFDNKKYDSALDSYRKSMNIYPEPDEETKLLLDIKINLCLMELQTINNDLIKDQNLNLEKFEQLCIRNSMNLKNYSLLAAFYRKTGLSIKSNSNIDPCHYFNKYKTIYKNMELKNALSPYSVLKHKPIIEALQQC